MTSWPYLISEVLVVGSSWPRTFFTPQVFLFSIHRYVHVYALLSLVQLCEEMFKRIEANTDPELTMAVEVTYLMHHLENGNVQFIK